MIVLTVNNTKMPRGPKKGIKRGPYKKKQVGFVEKIVKATSRIVKIEDPFANKTIYNLNSHPVSFNNGMVIQSSSFVRVAENSEILGEVQGIPVYNVSFSKGVLPPKSDDNIYIVSQRVCLAHRDRDDLYIPHRVNHVNKKAMGLVSNPFYIKGFVQQEYKENKSLLKEENELLKAKIISLRSKIKTATELHQNTMSRICGEMNF